VEKVAGEPIDNFLWHELFTPLGFKEMAWSRCPMGHPMGATGLYIRTSDMVKLGAIYLYGGEWKGHRYLSEEWVNIVLTRGYEMRPIDEATGAYGKGGMHGQKLAVMPQQRRVVAWHGNGSGLGDIMDWIIRHLD
jgi:CubicO group peptidase (beta-lactamase class C family)